MKKTLITLFFIFCLHSYLLGCDLLGDDIDSDIDTPEIVSLTFNSMGGSGVAPMENVNFGDTVNLPIPTRENHVFVGWFLYEQDTEITIDDNTQILGDWTLHAHWKLKTYNVIFLDYDDKILSYQTIEHGSAATTPSQPIKEGHSFTGWSESFSNITDHLTIHAQYEVHEYTVIFRDDEGSVIHQETVSYGNDASPPDIPILEGHTFVGWNHDFTNIKTHIDIHPTYIIDTYLVLFIDVDDKIISYQTIEHGFSATAPLSPSKEGHTFIGWSEGFDEVTEPLHIYAQYDINTYTITFDSNGGEAVDPITNIPFNNTVMLPEPSREDYHFIGWFFSKDIRDDNFTENRLITSNITLYAMWEEVITEVYHQVTFLDDDDTLLGLYQVLDGHSATPPSHPSKEGYHFIGWDTAFVTVTSDLVIRAQYEIQTFTVSFDSQGGTIIDEMLDVPYGSTILLPTPVKEDYVFMGWELENQLFTETDSIIHDITLLAVWTPYVEYTITFESQGGSLIDDLTVGCYSTVESLPIPEKTDYTFEGWMYEETLVEAPFVYTFDDDITLTAVWRGVADGLRYEISQGEVTILGYDGIETELIIPDTIDGYPVTIVAFEAFKDHDTLMIIEFGQFLTTIEDYAFSNMEALTHLYLPNATQNFGEYVLKDSMNLVAVRLSSEIAYTLSDLFGDDIDAIPLSLSIIKFADGGTLINDTLLNSNLKHVYIELADDMVHVPSEAFKDMLIQTAVILPEGTQTIGSSAFYNSGVTKIYVASTVETIGTWAFAHTTDLDTVIFAENSQLKTIQTAAFWTSAIKEFILPKSVETIASSAFTHCTDLELFMIPDDSLLTTIGDGAFFNVGLSSIFIPESVTFIDYYAFKESERLTIYVGHQEKPVNWHVAWNSDNLPVYWDVQLYKENQTLAYALLNTNEIIIRGRAHTNDDSEIVIPDTLEGNPITQIQGYAFYNDEVLITLHIGKNVQAIGVYAFGYTTLVEATVSDDSQLTTLEEGAFHGSFNMTSFKIPSALESIGKLAFYATSLRNVIIPNHVTVIGYQAFLYVFDATFYVEATSKPTGWSTSWNPSDLPVKWGILEYGDQAGFKYVVDHSGNAIILAQSRDSEANELAVPETINTYTVTTIQAFAFKDNTQLITIFIPTQVTVVGLGAFSGADNVTIYTSHTSKPSGWSSLWNSDDRPVLWDRIWYDASIYESLRYIISDDEIWIVGQDHTCTERTIVIPETIEDLPVTTIVKYAFESNEQLYRIYIPESITTIDHYAFRFAANIAIYTAWESAPSGWSLWNTSWRPVTWDFNLTDYETYEGFYYLLTDEEEIHIVSQSFDTDASDIVVPAMIHGAPVTKILANAFRYNLNIQEIFIPNSVLEIQQMAFAYTKNLSQIQFQENSQFTELQWGTFQYSGLESIVIPSSVQTIGSSVFWNAEKLSIITFEANSQLTTIGQSAFRGSGLTSIHIPASVTVIGNQVFQYTADLTQVTFEANSQLESIGRSAFSQTGIIELIIPSSVITIHSYAFNNNSSLSSIVIESNSKLETIGSYAFTTIPLLESIYIPLSVTTMSQGVFLNSFNLTVYVAANAQPESWHEDWNSQSLPVVWGYDLE